MMQLLRDQGTRKGNAPPIYEPSPQAKSSYGRGVPLAGALVPVDLLRSRVWGHPDKSSLTVY